MGNKKSLVVAFILFVSLVAGFLDRGTPSDAWLTTQATLSIALIFAWVVLDSRDRGYRVSWALKAALICLTVFSLPYYLFRSRGWKAGGISLAWAWGLFIAAMLFYRAGAAI